MASINNLMVIIYLIIHISIINADGSLGIKEKLESDANIFTRLKKDIIIDSQKELALEIE